MRRLLNCNINVLTVISRDVDEGEPQPLHKAPVSLRLSCGFQKYRTTILFSYFYRLSD